MGTKTTQEKQDACAGLAAAAGSAVFSPCCHASVKIAGSKEGTHWHECVKCGEACDPRDLGVMLENLHSDLVVARVAAVLLGLECAEEVADALECIEAARVLCPPNTQDQP